MVRLDWDFFFLLEGAIFIHLPPRDFWLVADTANFIIFHLTKSKRQGRSIFLPGRRQRKNGTSGAELVPPTGQLRFLIPHWSGPGQSISLGIVIRNRLLFYGLFSSIGENTLLCVQTTQYASIYKHGDQENNIIFVILFLLFRFRDY